MCVLTLCAGLLLPALAVDEVCFTAINDTILPLSADTMPVWSGGILYVPYSVFDTNTSGVSLGTSCVYNKRNNTVSVFSLSKMVLFDLNNGTCIDQETNKHLSAKAILRNGKAYLPAAKVSGFFGLQNPSYMSTEHGYLIRLKSNSAVLSDSQFADAASDNMSRRLREYQQTLLAPTPEPPAEQPPTTTPSVTTPPDTTPPVTPAPSVTPAPETPAVPTYLAFRCTTSEAAASIAQSLEDSHKVGLFFFHPRDIGKQGDLIRRLIGSGHSIGILAEGDTFDQTAALLEAGARTLDAVAHLKTYFALVPKAQQVQASNLGWACWNSGSSPIPDGSTSNYNHAMKIIRSLPKSGRAYITLNDSQYSASCLSSLLQQLENRNYILSVPRETRL